MDLGQRPSWGWPDGCWGVTAGILFCQWDRGTPPPLFFLTDGPPQNPLHQLVIGIVFSFTHIGTHTPSHQFIAWQSTAETALTRALFDPGDWGHKGGESGSEKNVAPLRCFGAMGSRCWRSGAPHSPAVSSLDGAVCMCVCVSKVRGHTWSFMGQSGVLIPLAAVAQYCPPWPLLPCWRWRASRAVILRREGALHH